jgi:hypothetical protein
MPTREEAVERYPLAWPLGWVRTPSYKRARSSFQTKSSADGRLSVIQAVGRLERELELLGGKNPTLSTNVPLRLDGRPRSENEPTDPGAAVYFTFKGHATVFACDKWTRVADNIAAIAAHIDAIRRVDRYGVGSLEQALAGYKALPADTAADWRKVLGFPETARPTAADVDVAFKRLAREKHPDVGGSDVEFAHIARARDFALHELGAASW